MSWINLTQSYFQTCQNALTNPNVMANFKSMAGYFVPVGYGDTRFCISQSKSLNQATSSVLANSSSFAALDAVGNPPVKYKGVSSDVWKVMESVHLLSSSFGPSIQSASVFEFGSGVGNLMYGLKITFPNMAYTASDFGPVNSLSAQYIHNVSSGAFSGGLTNVTYSVPDSLTGSTIAPNLFISELALTENDSGSMSTYYNDFVKHADYVFMRINCSSSVDRNNFVNQLNNDFTQSAYYCSDQKYKSTDFVWIGYK